MSESQNREETIFEAAAQLTVEQRVAFLNDACGNDVALQERVEILLAAYDRGGSFMEEPVAMANLRVALSSVLSSEKPGDRIGRYKLLQSIGEGGCGVVYMAEQQEPMRRQVALKVIKLGMDTKNVVARFEAERQALALMDHPNIAKVFDAGATEKGRPFFVMELVQGTKITRFCDENRVSMEERLKLFVGVCQAIQHAHQKGIIHRDIKPSNILVTLRDGAPVPKVIDFGIAKATTNQRLTDKTVFTAFEQFIGTPAYMSPEQAAMSDQGIDTRTDIYSLGVLLYELLTGVTPFDARQLREAGLDEIRRIIREEEPARPSTRLSTLTAANLTEIAKARAAEPAKLSGLFRGELDWIVMKALEKDRNRRYDTAVDLAQDVERYLAKEPIVARPRGDFYRFKTMVRRNKLAFGAAAAVICALVIGLGISLWEFMQMSRAEREQNHLRQQAQNAQVSEERLRRQAQTQELDAREAAYSSDMNLVLQVLDEDNIGRARQLLNRHRPKAGEQDLRGWEWRYFWGLCQSDAAFALRATDGAHIYTLSYSSDGSLLAAGSDQQLLVWDLSTRKVIFRPPFKINFPCRATFALKGDLLAYTEPTEVVIWNSRTRTEVRRLLVGAAIHDVRFTADGRVFTTSDKTKDQIQFWDPATGQVLSSLSRPIPAFPLDTRCVITDDGDTFAGAGVGFGASDTITFTDTANGTDLWHVRAADDFLTTIALSPVDQLVATGAGWMESTIKLWNRQTHQLVARLDGHRAFVSCLRFTPDGKMLVSASGDGTIRLWDIENRKLMRTLQGHTNSVWTVTVSPDGQKLASGTESGEVLCWDLASSLGHRHDYRWLTNGVDDWCFSSDGREIATYRTNKIQIHDAATLQVIDSPQLDVPNINSIAFSPDDRLLVVTADDGQLAVWDLEHRLTVTNFQAHPGAAWLCGSGFVNHGKGLGLVTVGGDQLAKEWDVATWRENRRWWVGTNIFAAALDPNTGLNVIATFSTNDVWVRKAELIRPGQTGPPKIFSTSTLETLDLSLDGKVVAVADHGTITLWDTQTAALMRGLRTEGAGAIALAFSPDGRLLAGSQNGKEAIKLWDLNSGYEVGALEAEGAYFSRVRWSPDGKSVGAINWHGTLCLWDAFTWNEIAAMEPSPP